MSLPKVLIRCLYVGHTFFFFFFFFISFSYLSFVYTFYSFKLNTDFNITVFTSCTFLSFFLSFFFFFFFFFFVILLRQKTFSMGSIDLILTMILNTLRKQIEDVIYHISHFELTVVSLDDTGIRHMWLVSAYNSLATPP